MTRPASVLSRNDVCKFCKFILLNALILQGYDVTDVAYKSNLKRNSLPKQLPTCYDSKTYFFSKFGSSFNQFPHLRVSEPCDKKSKLLFSVQHLQAILTIAKKLLTKETLNFLDEQSVEIYSTGKIKIFPYKTYSETMNLVMVTLLRELLQPQKELPVPFTRDVQEFVKGKTIVFGLPKDFTCFF